MLLALLLACGQASPVAERNVTHAALHPTGSDLYFEIPDVRAALAAYAHAPAIQLVESEGAANIAALAKDVGFDLKSVVGSLLPVADPARPDDRWWPWSAARRTSFSLGGIEAAPTTGTAPAIPSAWMVVDFAAVDAAEQAVKALVAMGGKDPVAEGELTVGDVTTPIQRIGSPFEPVLESAWLARLDTRIVLGAGDAKPADFAARAKDASGGLAPAWRADDAAKRFGATTGVTVLEILSDMDDLPAFAREGLSGSIASYALFFVAPFTCAKGRWRIDLQGDRFVTQGLYEPRGPARDLLAPFGATKLPERAAQLVPPDAVGCWITSVDAASAENAVGNLVLQALAEGEAKIVPPADGEPRMADGLGTAMAVSLLPFQSLMAPTPRILLTLELKDAARFQAGLENWLQRAQAAFPNLKIERKPYKKVPTIVLAFDAEEEAGAKPADGSPFGAGMMEPSRPMIAVLEDRVVFASAPTVARNEIKRLQEKEAAEPHKIADATGRPADVFEASTMDWTGFLSKVYDGVRGFAPMLAQNLDKPIDVEKLPTAAQLFAGFRPTKSWARRVDGRIHSWSESSFGPETPVGLAGLGFVGAKAAQAPRKASIPEPTASTDEGSADAKLQETLVALREVRTSIAVYRSQFGGAAPATLDELLKKTDQFPDGFLPSGKVPADAWGRALVYRAGEKGAPYALRSTGADGVDQDGAGDDVRLP